MFFLVLRRNSVALNYNPLHCGCCNRKVASIHRMCQDTQMRCDSHIIIRRPLPRTHRPRLLQRRKRNSRWQWCCFGRHATPQTWREFTLSSCSFLQLLQRLPSSSSSFLPLIPSLSPAFRDLPVTFTTSPAHLYLQLTLCLSSGAAALSHLYDRPWSCLVCECEFSR